MIIKSGLNSFFWLHSMVGEFYCHKLQTAHLDMFTLPQVKRSLHSGSVKIGCLDIARESPWEQRGGRFHSRQFAGRPRLRKIEEILRDEKQSSPCGEGGQNGKKERFFVSQIEPE